MVGPGGKSENDLERLKTTQTDSGARWKTDDREREEFEVKLRIILNL